uniref:WGS project CAEQ00000000 data, annotated contig 397 n=1 Tax=Trypanosoma congolense (strain IL3000) TaxID=1068625 RepID=F9WFK3_TRYCI|nr:unnamed protein product [Trypanosoma congolense IL3000]
MGCGNSRVKNGNDHPSCLCCTGGKGWKDMEVSDDEESGIHPFSPSSSLCEWYNKQLEEGCRRFGAPIDEPARIERRGGKCKGGLQAPKANGSTRETSDATVTSSKETERIIVYHVEPLERVIGRGTHSDVRLANMTAYTMPKSVLKSTLKSDCTVDAICELGTKYLIACKEYAAKDISWLTFEELVKEADRLSRLRSCSRLLRVLRVERVLGDTEESSGVAPAEGKSEVFGRCISSESRSFLRCIEPLGTLRKSVVEPSGSYRDAKLRIYVDYAKYGTLRDVLLKEIPEKFNRTYMHELSIRAYMRQVLLALAVLHEAEVVHSDLCARNIYISNSLSRVYGTMFPAYIADIPAGPLDKVAPGSVVQAIIAAEQENIPLFGTEPTTPGACESNGSLRSASAGRDVKAASNGLHSGPPLPRVLKHKERNEPFGKDLKRPAIRQAARFTSVAACRSRTEAVNDDSTCSHWADDEVRHLVQENSYNDDEIASILSSDSGASVSAANGLLKGGKFVRKGSINTGLVLPEVLPTVDCVSTAENSTATYVKGGGESETRNLLNCGGRASARVAGGHLRVSNNSMLSSNCIHARSSRVLVKLGHYGLIRSILVSDKKNVPHLLGSVTHLAPETMERSELTPASDIYAFAMTFIELASPNGSLYDDLRPQNPKTAGRALGESEIKRLWMHNIRKYIQDNFHDVPLPQQLSEECRAMLRRCLSRVPEQRPTAVELLRHKYFLLGHWASDAVRSGSIESPWRETDFEAAALACGLSFLSTKEEKA